MPNASTNPTYTPTTLHRSRNRLAEVRPLSTEERARARPKPQTTQVTGAYRLPRAVATRLARRVCLPNPKLGNLSRRQVRIVTASGHVVRGMHRRTCNREQLLQKAEAMMRHMIVMKGSQHTSTYMPHRRPFQNVPSLDLGPVLSKRQRRASVKLTVNQRRKLMMNTNMVVGMYMRIPTNSAVKTCRILLFFRMEMTGVVISVVLTSAKTSPAPAATNATTAII